MRTAAFAAAAACALSFANLSHALDITNDMGGNPVTYAQRFRSASKPIRILGTCGSACTIALGFGACVGPNAQLWFHAVTGMGSANAIGNRWVMGFYPAGVRSWIRAQGGLTSRKLVLKGVELRRRVKSCP